MTVAGESIPVHADMSIVIPPHTPHGYKNSSDRILRMIVSLADQMLYSESAYLSLRVLRGRSVFVEISRKAEQGPFPCPT